MRQSNVPDISDCHFYHTMVLPGHGLIEGAWDLRGATDAYLGNVDFAGQRVLEIGPASGYLAFEMERRGASVVSIEITDEPGWDFVPFPPSVMDPVLGPRRESMRQLKNSYWFAHAANRSNAELHYGDAYHLPESLGTFDYAVMANVLLHTHSPLQIIEQCAKRAKRLIIVEMQYPELEGTAVARLAPTPENQDWGTWWHFSSDFFEQFVRVMGFEVLRKTISVHTHVKARSYPMFTIVASL